MYLLKIRERKRKGVTLTCVDKQGKHHRIDRDFVPHFYVVDLPPRYMKDHRTAVIEPVSGIKPYIGYTSKTQEVLKFTTHKRRLNTWGQVYETRTPLTRQFLEEHNLSPGWNDIEVGRLPEMTDTPDLYTCSFDIECYSPSREFPDPNKPSNRITSIAMAFRRLHGGIIHKYVLSLDAEAGDYVEHMQTEEALLQRCAEVVSELDPDVLMGYNIDNFDMSYIDIRLQDKDRFYKKLSRYPDMRAKMHAMTFSSKQKGDIQTSRWKIPGRVCIDLLPLVRAHNSTLKYDNKYKSCKLDDVCKQELGASKTGFTYEEIFRAHETKDKEQNQKLVEYNIQDCVLVLELQDKLQFILTALQMSEISFTPVDDVLHRGVTARITNLLSRTVHAAGFYFNTSVTEEKKDQKPFQGAHCFPVIKAVHTNPILGVDFQSLYPSIIRRYNIDPSTLVLSKSELLPTDTTTERTLSDTGPGVAIFVNGKPMAPIPTLLRELGEARKAVKKRMKTEKQLYSVLNAKQMAIKVCMNSFYGYLGSTSFGYRELGASVTAYGRDLIRGTADYVLENYPGSVGVGGDTDSFYCHLGVPDMDLKECFRIGNEICEAINHKYGYPIVLEMEKVYKPMIYLAKKCYAAVMYESPTDTPRIDIKGIAVARGDCSIMTRKLQLDVINAVFNNPTEPWPVVKEIITEAVTLLKQKDKNDLIKTVKLGTSYKNPSGQVSVNVVARMKKRGQEEPLPGERVPYLVTRNKKRKRISDRADHPDHVAKGELDYEYYIDSQILKPLKRFLDILNLNRDKLY
jgi:DNA polymerase delta subunit 1